MPIDYQIDGTVVLRNGEPVADIHPDGEVEMREDCDHYQRGVSRWLNAQPEDSVPAPAKTPVATVPPESEEEEDEDYARRVGCPPPAAMHPRKGTKTPFYAQWLFDHRRDKYNRLFRFVGTRVDPIYNEDGVQVGEKSVILTERKTHLSEKVVVEQENHSGMSWKADLSIPGKKK